VGDRVGICVTGGVAQLSMIAGALRAGIVPVIVNPLLTGRERAVIQRDANPALWLDDTAAVSALLAESTVPPNDVARVPLGRPMHYTSGTTGVPKGVWTGVLDEGCAESLWGEEIRQWGFGSHDTHLVCSPLQHSAPIRFAIATWLAGGRVVVPPKFSADELPEVVALHHPNTAFCTPAHLQRLDERGLLGAMRDFRIVVHAGSACPLDLKRRAIDAIGREVLWEFYGSTEGQFTVCSADDWTSHPGSVGRARTGRTLTVDEDGTIWCTAPEWGRWSYWGDASRTAKAWRDGSFTVGDLGRIDADGFLYLEGRRSDLIVSGGVNVYPAEVEACMVGLPGVDEAVVFPRHDERWGQRVCAAYVGTAKPEHVTDLLRNQLAAYKIPKEIYSVGAIPRTGMDKVPRHRMAELLGLDAGREGSTSHSV
jgi:acyl-CoA synthetase (AMP-forming)/AMP-acid ligase II